ncbi:quinolinate synthase NadA [Inediibacterium massiliense]|uniref:quinolinate synthase NadA n=1 Tax=Inediibacterium massiliense TaxID=1658111 RepID=UPI0006B4821A|nr:quinolinate synthase NadA [Inediibacterium massiliense]
MTQKEMIEEIQKLKEKKNAVILAHNYQIPEIQDIADIVGDSLKLSEEAAKTNADCIVFCGVHFMAESAKILSPNKKVLLPVEDATCPMADMVNKDDLVNFKKENPHIPIVCYVNSSAEVKAESHVCCTSSNALRVVEGLKEDTVLFVPDVNLGSYIKSKLTQKNIILWTGYCITHHRVKGSEVEKVKTKYPHTKLLVHPECNEDVVKKADFVGSTSEIIQYASTCEDEEFIIGTEMGVLHSLQNKNPNKKFYLLSQHLTCLNMKKTTLEDVYKALYYEKNEVKVEEEIRKKALQSLNKMLELGR